jgi:hypothetical protein
MVLSTAIHAAAGRINRERQTRAELRLEELLKVEGIADEYEAIDRQGDLQMERRFATLYALVDSEAEKEAVAAAFATWMRTERDEEAVLRGSVGGAMTFLKDNNHVWIDGAAVPADCDGAA